MGSIRLQFQYRGLPMNIEERIAKLERGNRRHQVLTLGIGLAIGVVVGCYESAPPKQSVAQESGAGADVVRAKRIELSDNAGNSTVILPESIVIKGKGSEMAALTTHVITIGTDNGASITMSAKGSATGGAAVFSIVNGIGKPAVSISTNGDSGGMILLHDGRTGPDSGQQLNAALAKIVSADLAEKNANRSDAEKKAIFGAPPNNTVSIGTGETGGGYLNIYNTLGKRVASLQCSKANGGLAVASDVNGENDGFLSPRR